MPNLNIDELIDDPDFVTPGLVFWRTTSVPGSDGAPEVFKNRYPLDGTISPMKTRQLERLPEGFNTSGAMQIITQVQLSAGVARTNENADQVIYKGNLYLVKAVDDYSDWGQGFYIAFCELQGINAL